MKILYFILGFIKGIASGGGGGATVDPVHTVTFMSWDGSAVLGQRSVVDGDDCADMVARGEWETPTRESTDQYNYTYAGWSQTSGGAASSSALSAVTADRTVYAAFTSAVRYYTITYYDGDTLLKSESLAYGALPSYTPIKDGFTFQYWEPELSSVTGDAEYSAHFIEKMTLAGSSWAKISEISEAGLGESYFAVGDTKAVTINGQVGVYTISDTYYVYIIGFNHNSELEGDGITFGTFKSEATGGVDLFLTDLQKYNNNSNDGSKRFNLNHRTQYAYGGWAGFDARYDVLGSTDKAPSGYGSAPSSDRVGYDPSATCATSPVANTLMAALPSDLRAVMKPMTKYTCCKENSSYASDVIATVDYLPLLAEYELTGTRSYANQYEQEKQKQYDYYAAGNSKKKYRHTSTGSAGYWWLRSIKADSKSGVCYVNTTGAVDTGYPYLCLGWSPIFKV